MATASRFEQKPEIRCNFLPYLPISEKPSFGNISPEPTENTQFMRWHLNSTKNHTSDVDGRRVLSSATNLKSLWYSVMCPTCGWGNLIEDVANVVKQPTVPKMMLGGVKGRRVIVVRIIEVLSHYSRHQGCWYAPSALFPALCPGPHDGRLRLWRQPCSRKIEQGERICSQFHWLMHKSQNVIVLLPFNLTWTVEPRNGEQDFGASPFVPESIYLVGSCPQRRCPDRIRHYMGTKDKCQLHWHRIAPELPLDAACKGIIAWSSPAWQMPVNCHVGKALQVGASGIYHFTCHTVTIATIISATHSASTHSVPAPYDTVHHFESLKPHKPLLTWMIINNACWPLPSY